MNDTINEKRESFTFHLSRTVDLHPHITLNPVDGEILIVDDDTGETEPSECFQRHASYSFTSTLVSFGTSKVLWLQCLCKVSFFRC